MSVLLEKKKAKKQKAAVFQALKDDVISAIDDGKLAPGEPLPSENLLTKKYGISRSSVRQALEEMEKEGKIEKRPGKGSYVRDATFDPVKETTPIRTIGVDVELPTEGENWYGSKLLRGVKSICQSNTCRMSITNSDTACAMGKDYVDGLILTSYEDNNEELSRLLDKRIVPVVINRIIELEKVAYFSVNYRKEADRATDWLLERGHERIGYVTGPLNNQKMMLARYLGFQDAMNRKGFGEHCQYCEAPRRQVDAVYKELIETFIQESDITAIHLSNGSFARPLFMAMQSLGMKSPDDLDIVVFDDVEYLFSIYQFPLAFVKMPLEQMGRDASEYLIAKFKDPDEPARKKLYQAEICHIDN